VTTEVKIDLGKLVPIAILSVTVLVGLGVWSSVQAMQSRVAELEIQVEQLEELHAELEAVQEHIVQVRADMMDIARSRDDILEAICRILERRPEQCGVAPPQAGSG
jgi:hypothetical protein